MENLLLYNMKSNTKTTDNVFDFSGLFGDDEEL